MQRGSRALFALLAAAGMLAVPGVALAHPVDDGDKDFGDFVGSPTYDPSHSSHGNADLASPNMWHTANRMNPGTTN